MPDDTELLAKLKRLYSPEAFAQVRWQLENLRRLGAHAEAEALRESFFARMWDVSPFMKGLKQRFSGWHNRRRLAFAVLAAEAVSAAVLAGTAISRAMRAIARQVSGHFFQRHSRAVRHPPSRSRG